MTAVVERDPQLVERFRACLGAAVAVLTSPTELDDHLRRNPGEYALVLGPSVDDATAASIAEGYRITRPSLGVVRVRETVDNSILADALRSGMREVVPATDSAGLAHAVDRARAVAGAMSQNAPAGQAPPTRVGSVVTVFSTKGGVGKTVVATNLATALADRGHRTCVLDLDLACGDVAIMLQLTPLHTLADLADLNGELDASALESLITPHSDGLAVLAAPVQLGAPVPPDQIGSVLDTLRTMFDVVVVDTGGAFDDHSLQALDRSDNLVLVGTLDIPALKNLKVAAGTLDLLNIPRERWRLLLNRADPKVGLSATELEETLGLKADVSIPSSRDVLVAVNRGETLVRANRGHQISKAIAVLAGTVAPAQAPAAPTPTGHAGGRRLLRAKKVS